MDAGEVMKNVVEQTNNVTTGNETNSELETVPPNRFTLLFKIPCIYDKCSSDMYIVFWIGNIMLLMGIFESFDLNCTGQLYMRVLLCW